MIKTMLRAAAVCALALSMAAPAVAQNLTLRAPQWAQALLAADVTPTTGGRASIGAEGVDLAIRVTIAPTRGGVARVIRYDLRDDEGTLAVRRFTGHPSTGWWLWGSDAPRIDQVPAAQRAELATLARAVMGVSGSLGGNAEEACPAGEQAYLEVALEGRAMGFSRSCVGNTDAAGRLALKLSELAGSRTEEELSRAAITELLEADRAFAAKASADGVPAAFNAYAAEDAVIIANGQVSMGRAGVAARYQNWPDGARLEWSPESGRVSARGDMGWTWGVSTHVAPDGARTQGRYISVWTRDYDGNWRYAFDGALN